MRMQRRSAGGHIHVQQALDQRMPARIRPAIATSIRQTRDRLETAQFVSGIDDMSEEEESADVLGQPQSSVQTSLRRLHVNLGHPKNNVMKECHEIIACQDSFQDVDLGQRSIHGLLVETADSEKTHAAEVEQAKTRRNAKPDDCAIQFEIHNHLSTTGWLDKQDQIFAVR